MRGMGIGWAHQAAGWAGESSRCEDGLRPYSRRLRGGYCVSHCDPNVAIVAASMCIPCHPWKPTLFITDSAWARWACAGGRATLGHPLQWTAPLKLDGL